MSADLINLACAVIGAGAAVLAIVVQLVRNERLRIVVCMKDKSDGDFECVPQAPNTRQDD